MMAGRNAGLLLDALTGLPVFLVLALVYGLSLVIPSFILQLLWFGKKPTPAKVYAIYVIVGAVLVLGMFAAHIDGKIKDVFGVLAGHVVLLVLAALTHWRMRATSK